jgi:hypothetical protein
MLDKVFPEVKDELTIPYDPGIKDRLCAIERFKGDVYPTEIFNGQETVWAHVVQLTNVCSRISKQWFPGDDEMLYWCSQIALHHDDIEILIGDEPVLGKKKSSNGSVFDVLDRASELYEGAVHTENGWFCLELDREMEYAVEKSNGSIFPLEYKFEKAAIIVKLYDKLLGNRKFFELIDNRYPNGDYPKEVRTLIIDGFGWIYEYLCLFDEFMCQVREISEADDKYPFSGSIRGVTDSYMSLLLDKYSSVLVKDKDPRIYEIAFNNVKNRYPLERKFLPFLKLLDAFSDDDQYRTKIKDIAQEKLEKLIWASKNDYIGGPMSWQKIFDSKEILDRMIS